MLTWEQDQIQGAQAIVTKLAVSALLRAKRGGGLWQPGKRWHVGRTAGRTKGCVNLQ